jgi:CTD kinase subunit alpha
MAKMASPESMPPPTIIPIGRAPSVSSAFSESRFDTAAPQAPRGVVKGFKPIGQASSAVKRFFPGDDDDDEPAEHLTRPGNTYRTHPKTASIRGPPNDFDNHLEPQKQVLRRETYPSPPTISELPSCPNGIPEDRGARDVPGSGSQGLSPPRHISAQEDDEPIRGELQNGELAENRTAQVSGPEEGATPNVPPLSVSSRNELYKILNQVGEGTFGKVYKAQNTVTGAHVALKRIRMESERDGFPVTAMREIKLLQSLRHQNIVRLYEMMVSNGVYNLLRIWAQALTFIVQSTSTWSLSTWTTI